MTTTCLLIDTEYMPAILSAIQNADSDIKIMMFDYRHYASQPAHEISKITLALINAVKQGIKISVLCNHQPVVNMLLKNGINARKWHSKNLLHAKACIFDGKIAIVGSHNFTGSAMNSNIELSALINDSDFSARLSKYFDNLWSL